MLCRNRTINILGSLQGSTHVKKAYNLNAWIFISYFLYISSTLLQLYALLIATQLVRNDMSQHRASADNVTYLILA